MARAVTSVSAMLALVALAWLPLGAVAEVTAVVEPRIVDELDTVRLIIRATDTNQAQRLDLEVLEKDFEVLTTQSASQYRSVNGSVESWVEYQVMLRPRRAGEISIPPIQVAGESTPALTLQVRGMEPDLRDAIDRMVFFETELTKNPVYVQAQTVMVRRLYYASGAQIYSDLPGVPEVPNAIVMSLGETGSTTMILDGQRYGVIEQRFAIFPEQSGKLTIPPTSVTSSVRLEVDGRTRRSGVRIATDPMTLEVLPIPPEYPADQPWLPAERLTVTDRWTPVDARVEVGDPITRTLTAMVEGNVSSVIPPLTPALPDAHFRRYPEPPGLRDDAGSTTVRGLREQTYAIMPTAPGTVRLPPTEVVWWDVTSRQVRTARAPERTLRITGAPAMPPTGDDAVAGAASAAEDTAANEPPLAEVDVRLEQVPWPGPDRRRALWLIMLAVLAAGAALAWWSPRRGPGTGPPWESTSRRACWKALKIACREGDAAAIHHALLEYLRAHYRTSAAQSARQFRQDGHGPVLDTLNADRYRPGGEARVSGHEVLDAVREVRGRRTRRTGDPLPALYD